MPIDLNWLLSQRWRISGKQRKKKSRRSTVGHPGERESSGHVRKLIVHNRAPEDHFIILLFFFFFIRRNKKGIHLFSSYRDTVRRHFCFVNQLLYSRLIVALGVTLPGKKFNTRHLILIYSGFVCDWIVILLVFIRNQGRGQGGANPEGPRSSLKIVPTICCYRRGQKIFFFLTFTRCVSICRCWSSSTNYNFDQSSITKGTC